MPLVVLEVVCNVIFSVANRNEGRVRELYRVGDSRNVRSSLDRTAWDIEAWIQRKRPHGFGPFTGQLDANRRTESATRRFGTVYRCSRPATCAYLSP